MLSLSLSASHFKTEVAGIFCVSQWPSLTEQQGTTAADCCSSGLLKDVIQNTGSTSFLSEAEAVKQGFSDCAVKKTKACQLISRRPALLAHRDAVKGEIALVGVSGGTQEQEASINVTIECFLFGKCHLHTRVEVTKFHFCEGIQLAANIVSVLPE